MKGKFVLLIALALLCFCSVACGLMYYLVMNSASLTMVTNYEYKSGEVWSSNKFLSIDISGVIYNDKTNGGLFAGGGVGGYEIKEQLMAAAKDNSIAGVILEIDSPGGTVVGSKAISDGVKYYRDQTKKPIIAHVRGQAASGGYWVAAAADYIIADTGSITGSIGVIFGPFKYYDKVIEEGSLLGGSVVTQNGIETTYITAGGSKDVGSSYRRMSADEVAVLQQAINSEYDIFVNHVAERRKLDANKVRSQIKALFYSNAQSKELGLIDIVGSREDAYAELAKRAGVLDYKIVQLEQPASFLSQFLGAQKVEQTTTCGLCDRPLFIYGTNWERLIK